MIVNILTGLLEKKYNRSCVPNIFHTYEEANEIAKLCNKTVKFISNTNENDLYTNEDQKSSLMEELRIMKENKEKYKKFKSNWDNDVKLDKKYTILDKDFEAFNEAKTNYKDIKDKYYEFIKKCKELVVTNEKKQLYVVVLENEELLITNFKSIKDMIYNYSYIEIIKMYNLMVQNNIEPIAVHTDSILFDITQFELKSEDKNVNIIDTEKLNNIFNFNNNIGGYKLEYNKKVISVPLNYQIKNDTQINGYEN